MKLRDVAQLVGGQILGDPEIEINGVSGISDASECDITFLANKKFLKEAEKTKASCIIVSETIEGMKKAQLKVQNPYYAFAKLLEHFYIKPYEPKGISTLAFIGKNVKIGADVSVYPFSYISEGVSLGNRTIVYPGVFIGENSAVGDDSILYPNVVVREGVRVGTRVIIHAGAVIGSDGFGYTFHEGRHAKIPQVGGVIIEDDVEIGANVAIDRATTGNTIIGRGTKLDNLVQVGHNVRVGEYSIIVAQVAIGGSSTLGRGVVLGGQVGVSDHADIEAGTMVGAKSGIMPGNLAKGIYSGVPAIPHREWLKASSLFSKLPELQKKIKELEEKINALQRRHGQ